MIRHFFSSLSPRVIAVLSCFIIQSFTAAAGQPIPIADASFDDRVLAAGSSRNSIAPWREEGRVNENGFVSRIRSFRAAGQNHLGMNTGHDVWQDLGVVYQPHTRYTLTVAVGRRIGQTQLSNQSGYLLADPTGAIHASGSFNASQASSNFFQDAPQLVFETGEDSPAIGRTIRILLQARGDGTSHYDHIRLTAHSELFAEASTLEASDVSDHGATLHATANAFGTDTSVEFEYGTTAGYGMTVPVDLDFPGGDEDVAVSAVLSGLMSDTTYHYRVTATNIAGTVHGEDRTFTTSGESTLAALTLSEGGMMPDFTSANPDYTLTALNSTESITLTPVASFPGGTITVNGAPVSSGATSQPIELAEGDNLVEIAVAAADGVNSTTYTVRVTRMPERLRFDTPDAAPLELVGFNPAGTMIGFDLAHHPQVGTDLVAIRQAGVVPIDGEFDNLAHGDRVILSHEGIDYEFAADYFGGDGNDLVLRWANRRILAWGDNNSGQLGDGTEAARADPVATDPERVLADAAIRGIAAGDGFTIALLVDGRMAAWGINDVGQLGNGSLDSSRHPVWVDTEGVLEGRTVVRVVCGSTHVLALCSDGTLVAWGSGSNGKLGYGGSDTSAVPVRVDQTGALAGKRIIDIAAGRQHSMAVCDDGTLVAWGLDTSSTSGGSFVPNLVESGPFLLEKRIIGISAGYEHNLAVTSDGALFSWGRNQSKSLGYDTSFSQPVPEPRPVAEDGVLFGRPAVSITSAGHANLTLAADGSLVEWGGANTSIGDVSLVFPTGDLLGRNVLEIASAPQARLVRCDDNTLVQWPIPSGFGSISPPELVDLGKMRSTERLAAVAAGEDHFLALVDSPPAPQVETLAAIDVGDDRAVLRGRVRGNGGGSSVYFEYGPTPALGRTVAAMPSEVDGIDEIEVSAEVGDLLAGGTYFFRVAAAGDGGTALGQKLEFSTTRFTSLADLSISRGSLAPAFDPQVAHYDVVVPSDAESVTVTPTVHEATSVARVVGDVVASGEASGPLALRTGDQTIEIEVTAEDGETFATYRLNVIRLPEVLALDGSGTPLLTAESLEPAGIPLPLALAAAPPVGTDFTLVQMTGASPILGEFEGIGQGQILSLEYEGIGYDFAVNYFGGSGNDLVLQWANNRPIAWGFNFYGQLGIGTSGHNSHSAVPLPVERGGVLEGKTVIAMAGGNEHTLALCSDGTLASWGRVTNGRLGLGPDHSSTIPTNVPLPVYMEGVLAEKHVIQLAAGSSISMALCSDGTLVTWGGESGSAIHSVPELVDHGGVLAGRRVVAIDARNNTRLAVCADGRVYAWGANNGGQLGTGNTTGSTVPLLVDSGALAGRRVVSAGLGFNFALALCDDGELVAWGTNNNGQFGNGETSTTPSLPVLVNPQGALSGKTVVGIAVGSSHVLAWSEDGTLAAWGSGNSLGNGPSGHSSTPVLIDRSEALAGKTVVKMAAGGNDSLALCDDGTVAHWGTGFSIGMSSTTPTALDLSDFAPGERVVDVAMGSSHGLGMVAIPPPPRHVETLAASSITDTGAILHGQASGNGSTAGVRFEYGLTPDLGRVAHPEAMEVSGTSVEPLSFPLDDLAPDSTYHYRVVAENDYGTVIGETMSFTTTTLADLAGLALDPGQIIPVFSPSRLEYDVTLPADADEILITPTPEHPGASVTVAGSPAGPSVVVPLESAVTVIPVRVTSEDSLNARVYQITVTRLPQTLVFSAADDPLFTAGGFAVGGEVDLALEFAPPAGTSLTILRNNGSHPIHGTFANLAQDQSIFLNHAGIDYEFSINYFGGNGNDLVLQWANVRLLGCGSNRVGQLGDGTTIDRSLLTPVDMTGLLAGKIVTMASTGSEHSLVLFEDGTMATWGNSGQGRLGRVSGNTRVPGLVDQSGVLAGKRVQAIASGYLHNLALCTDGTLVSWGSNNGGMLGNDSNFDANVPTLVTRTTDVLAGRTVVAVAAGGRHSLVLCSDGTLATWGRNIAGQLGIGTQSGSSSVPVLVDRSGVLADKQVIAIAAQGDTNTVLCSDGTLVAWGDNRFGQLGDGTTTMRNSPVLVDQSGVLAGKKVEMIARSAGHVLALCSDGTLAAWGVNGSGALGNGTTTNSTVPVLVDRSGGLADKTIIGIYAGAGFSYAVCSDGTLFAWGDNGSGQLGANTTINSSVPVEVDTSMLLHGERIMACATSMAADTGFVISAQPPRPRVITQAADPAGDNSAVLHADVNANGRATTVFFEYGLTPEYGFTTDPIQLDSTGMVPVNAGISGLLPAQTYHFRVVATGDFGVVRGESRTFSSSDLTLAMLSLDGVSIFPAFDPRIVSYHAVVPAGTGQVTVIAEAAQPEATIEINGGGSTQVMLETGDNEIRIVVTADGGASRVEYLVMVTRLPSTFTYRTPDDAAIGVPLFDGTGNDVSFALEYAPAPGTQLTVVRQAGIRPIQGEFDNLAHGQEVLLEHDGIAYRFVANYSGGDGNDLVLHWAETSLAAWGRNQEGQLGNGLAGDSPRPVHVDQSGVLAGKTIVAVASGFRHSLALCSDGTLVAWGSNTDGQLGDGTTISRSRPVLVDQSGALAGKTVVAISAADSHSLALCSDGSLFSWGSNGNGRLGIGSGPGSPVPVAVSTIGALEGKRPVAISSAGACNLVLCDDGSLVSWGSNGSGQLGVAGFSGSWSHVPLLVDASGPLADRRVVRIVAGTNHMMVLCSDGSLVAWGNHQSDLWGTGENQRNLPTLVPATGLFGSRAIVDFSLGANHSLALCDDQTIIAWGNNTNGRLGNNSTARTGVPVLVDRTGVLASRQVARVVARSGHGFAVCDDGTVAAWGANGSGQLGTGTTTQSLVPAWVELSGEFPAAATLTLSTGVGEHTLRVAAAPPAPLLATMDATDIADQTATLNAEVAANGGVATVFFQLGTSTSYGMTIAATPAVVEGAGAVPVHAAVDGLMPGTTYHYRVIAEKDGVVSYGESRSFTTTSDTLLAGLALDAAALTPAFSNQWFRYDAAVPYGVAEVRVTAMGTQADAVIRVNGALVASGEASATLPLEVGANEISVEVDSGDEAQGAVYRIIVTRLPEVVVINSGDHPPIRVNGMVASGLSLPIELGHEPQVGSDFTLVSMTGFEPIEGMFEGLAQGQTIRLEHGGITYPFVVDYRGGGGNDLVLRWGNVRAVAWGANASGILGDLTTNDRFSPVDVAVPWGGLRQMAAGETHSLALYADGTLLSWGSPMNGRLGREPGMGNNRPGEVEIGDLLEGRQILSVAAGLSFSLALADDGAIFSWGSSNFGELGVGSFGESGSPVRVLDTGVLAGRRVTAIAAGSRHALALCSDGSLVAWGANDRNQLGIGTTSHSLVPVAVDITGALAGKRVVAIAAGESHSVALCSDGTLVAWGFNSNGQLGNGTNISTGVPVVTGTGGALEGKTITAISAGSLHTLALTTDGTIAAWGQGASGRLGNGLNTSSNVPVAVVQSGVLAGKTVIGIDAGGMHNHAWCADGTVVSWGSNLNGRLGAGGTGGSNVPVLVSPSNLPDGRRFGPVVAGFRHGFAMVAVPPPAVVETLAAGQFSDTGATLHGRVGGNGSDAMVGFEYGLTADYGNEVSATPSTTAASGETMVAAAIDGLLPGSTYHFRVVARGTGGTVYGEDLVFTTTSEASLAGLTTDAGTPLPVFDPLVSDYALTVPHGRAEISVTAELATDGSGLSINGEPAVPGSASGPFPLAVGAQTIPLVVSTADGSSSRTHRLTVIRLPEALVSASPDVYAFSVPTLAANGGVPPIVLAHAPATGASLRLIENTGDEPVLGRFEGLPHGGVVTLSHGGIEYAFVANYFGGDGNDLVLDWANTRVLAWGDGANGKLGDGLSEQRVSPVPVIGTGALAGRTVVALAAGGNHSLALCADGGVVAWGRNNHGQLGTGTTTTTTSEVPVNVVGGALEGRKAVAVAAGENHSLALCSDGTLVAWGLNGSGQLGDGTFANRTQPVEVEFGDALGNRTIKSIAVGADHNYALASDGTVFAWGAAGRLRLGVGAVPNSPVPLVVDMSDVHGTTPIIAVAAGRYFGLALDSEGTLSAWGNNFSGQLGDGTRTNRVRPVGVLQTGVLGGRNVVAIETGSEHSLVLCDDGTMVAWGGGSSGQLGNGSTVFSQTHPVLVQLPGSLQDRPIVSIRAGRNHNYAFANDGALYAWGGNRYGQLGDFTTNDRSIMVPVAMGGLHESERLLSATSGSFAFHGLALVAMPPAPRVETLAATGVDGTAATLNAEIRGQGNATTVIFEYGPTPGYGFSVVASPSEIAEIAPVPVSARLDNLVGGVSYHFRVVATGPGGTVVGGDRVFTTGFDSTLTGLEILPGALYPEFSPTRLDYLATLSGMESLVVRPTAATEGSEIRVAGQPVASGAASPPLPLDVGENEISIVVTSVDGESQTYRVRALRLPAEFTFSSPESAALDVTKLHAHGDLPPLRLTYPPLPGTRLTLIRQAGLQPAVGRFDNLAHGETIMLEHDGIRYPFVANYHGGDGNDLVLQWANTRLFGFGANNQGQLGSGTFTMAPLPVPMDASGLLRERAILTMASGSMHNLAALDDGSVVSWGGNSSGSLGDGTRTSRNIPVLVLSDGALAGRKVVAVAGGNAHSLALCSDGTVVSWGANSHGQLGDGTQTLNRRPVRIDQSGVLAGSRVVAIAAGSDHSLAITADGRVASWGRNHKGQLGAEAGPVSVRPVWVDRSGVLADRTVIAVSAGLEHSLVLCSDGTLAAWGANDLNQLGDNGSFDSMVPVRVRQGDLEGKTVIAIHSKGLHNIALCSDGSLVAWGANANGRLGIGGSENARVPTLVATDRFATAVAAGGSHSLAVFADGTAAAWGSNGQGQLGNGATTSSDLPVAVDNSSLPYKARLAAGSAGQSHSFVIAAPPPAPVVETLTITAPRDRSTTLNGTVLNNGVVAETWFELGTDPEFLDRTVSGTPAEVVGDDFVDVMATVTDLLPGTTYHYRLVAANENGETLGDIRAFTTTSHSALAGLAPSQGVLGPDFSPTRTTYLLTLESQVDSLSMTPTLISPDSTVTVNGEPVASGSPSPQVSLASEETIITVEVTSPDGLETSTYQVVVTRLPELLTLGSPGDSLLTAESFSASGVSLDFNLGFTPAPGPPLRLLTLTGPDPLIGRFTNLEQGEIIGINHDGSTYHFVVNYHGGNGNDLELRWLNSRLVAWGANSDGQLGDDSTTSSKLPVPVDMTGVLDRRPVIQLAVNTSGSSPAAGNYTLALGADGTLAGWGRRRSGEAGGVSDPHSRIPVVMEPSDALVGKSLKAISAGTQFSLMLADDGTIAASGYNFQGTLGDNTSINSLEPVAVWTRGALRDRQVVAVSAGLSHSLALCSDGTVVAWGRNLSGALGVPGVNYSAEPLEVMGLPEDSRVIAVSAGNNFSLVLMENGEVFAWGVNNQGQLGMGEDEFQQQSSPVPVDRSGVLAGKRIIAISAGLNHSLALCDDGVVYAWGAGSSGQLGQGNNSRSAEPVEVIRSELLEDRFVTRISAVRNNSLALCSDGTLAVWGANALLGNDISGRSELPIAVSPETLQPGEVFIDISTGSNAGHVVAATALPLPVTEALEANSITGVSATIEGVVNARGNDTVIMIEYGSDGNFGNSVTATPGFTSGYSDTEVMAEIVGLTPGTRYHYRVVAESYGGIIRSPAMTFTTLSDNARLEDITSLIHLGQPFDPDTLDYFGTLGFDRDSVEIRPLTEHPGATVTVQDEPVVSGSASAPVPLEVGNNTITLVVTAEDGITTLTYTIVVTRLPQEFMVDGGGGVPLVADGFRAVGTIPPIRLGFHPETGTELMLVENTSLLPIVGRFSDMPQGRRITLEHDGRLYDFTVDYFGGDGNDLVLLWADTALAGWGDNSFGQLGQDPSNGGPRNLPAAAEIPAGTLLENRTVKAVGAGYLHSLALTADGMLAAWGYNAHGQLGNGEEAHSHEPVAVDLGAVPEGAMVVAVSAGPYHNLALCDDGTVLAWGFNNFGQLGDGTTGTRRVPVVVPPHGALEGRRVVAVAAGAYQSFALCSDGTVAAWGYNGEGELGDGTTTTTPVPVQVHHDGALAGRRVVEIAAGAYHTLARTDDGRLFCWGYNRHGQVGDGTTTDAHEPVDITASGALARRTVKAIAAGASHSYALADDGALLAWGRNHRSQLTAAEPEMATEPVLATVPAGVEIARLQTGADFGLLRATNGDLLAWGDNGHGQLGAQAGAPRAEMLAPDLSGLEFPPVILFAATGSGARHTLAVAALPRDQGAAPPDGQSGGNETLAEWRMRHFGTSENAGRAANDADANGDGVPNIAKYAFGSCPWHPCDSRMPAPERIGNRMGVRFPAPQQAGPDVVVTVEWSADLAPGGWVELPDSGSDGWMEFLVPEDSPAGFLRFRFDEMSLPSSHPNP